MPSRRPVLTSIGELAGVSLAGCLGGSEPDPNAMFRDEPPFPMPDDADIVARRSVDSIDDGGTVRGTVTAYDDPESEYITVLGAYRVLPDQPDWEHTEFHEIHDWSQFDDELFMWGSNLVPTSDEPAQANVSDRTATDEAHWDVDLVPPDRSPPRYLFRSVYPTDLVEGDKILEVYNEVTLSGTDDWLSDEISVETDVSLVYGEIDDVP